MEEYTNEDLIMLARFSPSLMEAIDFLVENGIFKMNKKEEDIYEKVHI